MVLRQILKELQLDFEAELIMAVLPFIDFKSSDKMFHDYYHKNKEKPFCKAYIEPKTKLLLNKFSEKVKENV